jgi:magnesium-transporting ATPase (P-type)
VCLVAGVVVNIGRTTEIGKISAAIQSATTTQTPLQIKLARLGSRS